MKNANTNNQKISNKFYYVIYETLWERRYNFLFMMILISILGATPSIDSYLIKQVLDFTETYDEIHKTDFTIQIFYWAVIYGLWWEGLNWGWRLYDYIYLNTLPKAKTVIIDKYFSHIQNHSYSFFQQNLTGTTANKVMDASRAFECIIDGINDKILRRISMIIIAIITFNYISPIFATVFSIWLVIFMGFSAIFAPKANVLSTVSAENRSNVAGKIVDSFSNNYSVQLYSKQTYEIKYLSGYLKSLLDSEKRLSWYVLILRYFQSLTCTIMIFSMIYYLGVLRVNSSITAGDFALVITLAIAVAEQIWSFTQDLGDLFEDIGTLNQTVSLLSSHEINDKSEVRDLVFESKITGNIEFKNVSFKFSDAYILKNQSILIPAKQKLGIVGFSGTGKTSFINLLARIYDPSSGEIRMDGVNIKDFTLEFLRNNISVIPQGPVLFDRSIYDNIAYGKPSATKEEVIEAAKKAHIHDEIMMIQGQYDARCGEKGSNLSGGQRQRIAIARAILKDAPIIVLDEATSALDTITEAKIRSAINFISKNKTLLVIAHRISTIKNMDRIILLNRGIIEADGDHSSLLISSGLYRSLWDMQEDEANNNE